MLAALVASLFSTPLSAKTGKCLLQVGGHTYLKGRCDINMEGGGDFMISTPEGVNPTYFAYVNLDKSAPGTATAAWNGKDAESHAGDDLGTVTRNGACWSNAQASICATAK